MGYLRHLWNAQFPQPHRKDFQETDHFIWHFCSVLQGFVCMFQLWGFWQGEVKRRGSILTCHLKHLDCPLLTSTWRNYHLLKDYTCPRCCNTLPQIKFYWVFFLNCQWHFFFLWHLTENVCKQLTASVCVTHGGSGFTWLKCIWDLNMSVVNHLK